MSTTNLPPRFLRTQEVARVLGLLPRTMDKHRTDRKMGGRMVYAVGNLIAQTQTACEQRRPTSYRERRDRRSWTRPTGWRM